MGDCEVGASKKACADCTCGRAEAEAAGIKAQLTPDMLENPQSACGSVSHPSQFICRCQLAVLTSSVIQWTQRCQSAFLPFGVWTKGTYKQTGRMVAVQYGLMCCEVHAANEVL